MPTRNALLLHRVAFQIEKHPEKYDQTTWGKLGESDSLGRRFSETDTVANFCGTHACIAGWAAVLELNTAVTAIERQRVRGGYDPLPLEDAVSQAVRDVTGYSQTIMGYAQQALGLTTDEANVLFAGEWRPNEDEGYDVPRALRELAEGADIGDVTQGGTEKTYRVTIHVDRWDDALRLARNIGADIEECPPIELTVEVTCKPDDIDAEARTLARVVGGEVDEVDEMES